jgi:Outer membrane protein and related peptidoglycan-associated (lipo)proteins
MTQNKWTLKVAALTAAVFAASCAEQAIRELEQSPRNEYEFNNALANEYEALAKKEAHIYNDEIDARHFAVKGLQAAAGMLVLPEDPARWDIHKKHQSMVKDGRARLLFALERGGRFVEPELGAKTQVAFDCLIEELEEGKDLHKDQPKEISVCHKLFMDRLSHLETAIFKNGPVRRIHFDYNSAAIEHDGTKTIAEVAERVRKSADQKIMIVGHTDPVGKAKANLTLSHNRALAVKKALIAHGVNEKNIKIAVGQGELKSSRRELEPNNRVADIYLM